MATSATILNLNQVNDVALVGPEIGTVNFRLLHAVLQVIIQQAGMEDVMVEFTGTESQQLQKILDSKSKGGIKPTQFNVRDESSKKTEKNKEGRGSVVVVPTDGSEVVPGFTIAVTTEAFSKLVADVENLKTKYDELTHLSNNADLMKAAQSNEGKGPIVDMYQILSLQKRIEAAEEGIAKMASIIEDVARVSIVSGVGANQASDVPTGTDTKRIIERAAALRTSMDSERASVTTSSINQIKELDKRLTELETKFGEMPSSIAESQGTRTRATELGEESGSVVDDDFSRIDLRQLNPEDALVLIQKEFKKIKTFINTLDLPKLRTEVEELKKSDGGRGVVSDIVGVDADGAKDKVDSIKPAGGGDITGRMAEMEVHFNDCMRRVKSLDSMFHEKMETISKHVTSIEKEVGHLTEKMQDTTTYKNSGSAPDNSADFYKRFYDLENKTKDISNTTEGLLDERNEREAHIAAIREQLDLLKTLKADKAEVSTQLADKVDLTTINRKVSHDQFDATCTDLTKGIEEALEKLTKQEELWQQALGDIQMEVGSKLDKMELGPLRDFITDKLSVLQGKLKALAKYKREQEAAGTKAALLKDVKCISCDKDVVMRKAMDPNLFPRAPALPPTKTMAPYLAYELDQLRKQQKSLASSRNMHHFEQIKKGDACNRYCGGSHTLTTPQQRVTRLGHFLEQWGPEVAMVSDSNNKGKDGAVYKGEEKVEPKAQQTTDGKVKSKSGELPEKLTSKLREISETIVTGEDSKGNSAQ